jgi:hypothetical protein
LYIPKKIIINPPILEINDIFDERKDPIHVADAPKRINTRENPATKNSELITTIRFSPLRTEDVLFFSFISVKVTPDIKEIYPGTRGRTQGDKKEINPAVKAMYMDTSGISYNLAPG